ncbi:hypothetical protein [Stratiformator vulcanicus]|uniref:Transmembrane protein n=1 Tax=Stratiformator vulcanicus TaxID=2527980 RepID=A0A517R0C6_9PLAN|nr:hypothetical protein [Stratiformator vulcanicus]QDT37318.1 hypothetical protein Pan189_16910 [Stratiformator vulcanicus]
MSARDSDQFLDTLKIASPCRMNWRNMEGDDRVRFCDWCEKKVYNLEGMSGSEAESLVAEHEGRMCVRMRVRHDRSVVAGNCPRGVRRFRTRVASVAASVLFLFATPLLCLFAPRAVSGAVKSVNRNAGNRLGDGLDDLRQLVGLPPAHAYFITGAVCVVPLPIAPAPPPTTGSEPPHAPPIEAPRP